MFKKILSLLLFIIALSTIFSAKPAACFLKADKILYNGKIFTSNTSNPFVEAVAVKGQCIIGVGTTQQMMSFQGPDTQMFNLAGRTAIPGFNDAHLHMLPYDVPGSIQLINPYSYLPGPGPNVQDVLSLIQQANNDPNIPAGTAFFVNVSYFRC